MWAAWYNEYNGGPLARGGVRITHSRDPTPGDQYYVAEIWSTSEGASPS